MRTGEHNVRAVGLGQHPAAHPVAVAQEHGPHAGVWPFPVEGHQTLERYEKVGKSLRPVVLVQIPAGGHKVAHQRVAGGLHHAHQFRVAREAGEARAAGHGSQELVRVRAGVLPGLGRGEHVHGGPAGLRDQAGAQCGRQHVAGHFERRGHVLHAEARGGQHGRIHLGGGVLRDGAIRTHQAESVLQSILQSLEDRRMPVVDVPGRGVTVKEGQRVIVLHDAAIERRVGIVSPEGLTKPSLQCTGLRNDCIGHTLKVQIVVQEVVLDRLPLLAVDALDCRDDRGAHGLSFSAQQTRRCIPPL